MIQNYILDLVLGGTFILLPSHRMREFRTHCGFEMINGIKMLPQSVDDLTLRVPLNKVKIIFNWDWDLSPNTSPMMTLQEMVELNELEIGEKLMKTDNEGLNQQLAFFLLLRRRRVPDTMIETVV